MDLGLISKIIRDKMVKIKLMDEAKTTEVDRLSQVGRSMVRQMD